jgi:hypothetical protein
MVLALMACQGNGSKPGMTEAVVAQILAQILPPPTPPVPGEGVWSANASPVPVYVLIGGDAADPPADRNGIFFDTNLDFGEIFILARSPLQAGTTYEVAVVAHTGSGPATEVFNHTWRFTTSPLAYTDGGNGHASPDAELAAYRGQCGLGVANTDPGYTQAAIMHAGYQRLARILTHEEDPPPPANVCFIDRWFWNRISLALAGTTWDGISLPPPVGFNVGIPHATMRLSEGLVAGGDLVAGLATQWNTVYHRLPLSRYDTILFGAGQSQQAAVFFADPPAVLTEEPRYATYLYGGNRALAQPPSYWPQDNLTGVPRSFYSDGESPDPIGEMRTLPAPNRTLPATWVGSPIHVALPVAVDFSGLVVTLTRIP